MSLKITNVANTGSLIILDAAANVQANLAPGQNTVVTITNTTLTIESATPTDLTIVAV